MDESRVKNAVPKREKLAKYGNKPYYYVFGKRYRVMHSNKHFTQVGVASWYGTKFHDRRTSSGERYDMLSMTAAHKSLPLPTYVEVTNLKNHRKVVVKVNDRGPFSGGRIIDLSYVAAKKLGMLGHGTTRVRITALDPDTYGKPMLFASHTRKHQHGNLVASNQQHAVYLQVGSFRVKANALKLQQRLVAMLTVPVNVANPSARSRLYRVQVGPFNDLDLANKISLRLKGLGLKSNKTYGA